ncbi:ribose 5-phosphate isomerase B [Thermovenabulum gondwanense]|uniref:Putative sugar phosphate isomerase YwlF n=1 Tax=Thermovenabulum gondwanense TaxID=520767 RepID=A0A162MDY9_9FIRM|nr:putative sugar phosphate isomerase YwlF [Thermovenabulum gondwanense]
MKIAVASDHGGYELKEKVVEFLKEKGYDFQDFGTFSKESVDYPDMALIVAEKVAKGEFERGILICGTGIGISIAANKVKGIRAALCNDVYSARMSRLHNDANILAMGGRVIGPGLALLIVEEWLKTPFEGGRHKVRVDKITNYEQGQN